MIFCYVYIAQTCLLKYSKVKIFSAFIFIFQASSIVTKEESESRSHHVRCNNDLFSFSNADEISFDTHRNPLKIIFLPGFKKGKVKDIQIHVTPKPQNIKSLFINTKRQK